MEKYLSRIEFKKRGFMRTNGMCCVPGCKEHAADAHHIMDRKLWNDGGYYLSNCAPVCKKHHLDCEQGVYTPAQVTVFCGMNPLNARKPDKLKQLTDEEYIELFSLGLINKWGE